MGNLDGWKIGCVVALLCTATAIALEGQAFTTLHTFDPGCSDGCTPTARLVQGTDGNLYGTTYAGGPYDGGRVFKITATGTLTTLHSFCSETGCKDGMEPGPGLVQAIDGNLYGTTELGGSNGAGTVYKVTPSGTLTTLHSFCSETGCKDGMEPGAGLVQAIDETLYGTTSGGGNGDCFGIGCGTVFKITPSGTLTTLHSFDLFDGFSPGGLIQAADGDFYGTTTGGGLFSVKCPTACGTVFRMTPIGTLRTLHIFDGADGADPSALLQATDGNFYGTTVAGGTYDAGTVFKITARGKLTTLHSFCSEIHCKEGDNPNAELIQATDGNLYGTTVEGGAHVRRCAGYGYGCGTIFRINKSGVLTTPYSFCSQVDCKDGESPFAALLQATDGKFYGTTTQGGGAELPCCGTVFSGDIGLGPFVSFVQAAGKVGQTGGILGQGFIGTTEVSVNGVPAVFTVVSDTYIKGTVPVGATTGYVTVTTPSGMLTSNVPFRVIP